MADFSERVRYEDHDSEVVERHSPLEEFPELQPQVTPTSGIRFIFDGWENGYRAEPRPPLIFSSRSEHECYTAIESAPYRVSYRLGRLISAR